ncbi:MAG TPA: efflux RND transporter periplasmic adaptor subunit [Vicinamibacterales bacterium]
MIRNRLGLGVAALALFGAGALAMYEVGARSARSAPSAPVRAAPPTPSAAGAAAGPLVVQISPELLARAGIHVESVQAGAAGASLRAPGTVQPNAYRKVSVTPLVGGRVRRVPVELGQHVSRGATLAEIYSPDLAEARTRYLSMKADFEAGEARVGRTERLAQIGAASQQELEGARAEHTRHQSEVEQTAARLRLLGVDPAHVTHTADAGEASATVRVSAPQEGVVLERPATVGMTVEPSTVLVTLVDLSPVWVIADVYERDFNAVQPGTRANVTADAYPGLSLPGRVTYVAPVVRPETRTVEVRVEVPNPAGKLRLGMFVTVTLEGIGRPSGTVVPRAAVQTVGALSVVYVALDQSAGLFEERPVVLGEGDQERVSVTGVVAGERIVTAGSFSLRAEAERSGRRRPVTPGASTSAAPVPQKFTVRVTAAGFEPSSLTLQAGTPARITFTRTTDETCAKEVVFPGYAIRRPLPLNQAVTVELLPKREDRLGFVCGMNMLKGTLVVQ